MIWVPAVAPRHKKMQAACTSSELLCFRGVARKTRVAGGRSGGRPSGAHGVHEQSMPHEPEIPLIPLVPRRADHLTHDQDVFAVRRKKRENIRSCERR
jgi:hypothetical protein